jgi:hypothetical protein
MKPFAVLGAVAALFALLLAWRATSARRREPVSEASTPATVADDRGMPLGTRTTAAVPPEAPPPVPGATVARKAGRDVRAEVRAVTVQARNEVTRQGLETYLDALEQRARAQGRVTAFEVQPGMALAEELTGDPEAAARFGHRMEALQKDLDSAPVPAR